MNLLKFICGNCLTVSFLQNVEFVKNPKMKTFICFCFDLTQFYKDIRKCFQIYMSNLGITGGPFHNLTKSLIVYHLTCVHYYIHHQIMVIHWQTIYSYPYRVPDLDSPTPKLIYCTWSVLKIL